MTRTERQAAIHQDAAENSAWDAFFNGSPMSWVLGESEVHQFDIARQREKVQAAQYAEGKTGRHPSDWAILAIVIVLVIAAYLGVFAS